MLTRHNEYSGIGPVLRGCLVRGITSSYMESASSWVCPIKCDERTQSQRSAYEPWGGDWSTHSIPKPNNNIMSSVMDHSIHQTKHPINSRSYVHKYQDFNTTNILNNTQWKCSMSLAKKKKWTSFSQGNQWNIDRIKTEIKEYKRKRNTQIRNLHKTSARNVELKMDTRAIWSWFVQLLPNSNICPSN